MCSWDIISDMVTYTTSTYPEVDIKKVTKKKFRRREYELIAIDDIIQACCDQPYNHPLDILEMQELIYEYRASKVKSDVYKIHLSVVKRLLIFLREREKLYG